ncbi:hypothetical protein RFI_28649 [Reticulomyxa filosa]|uniref:Uncharacterized protein n=1 Tax=Reticulomyxa filosa TaxID=46433 RepID=X6M426_RETFI|nr:hypothetical protein RFI_28649 [Reticulomyxa filosa]|eukprot:ETO08738.1 hypothetical protein RFI_28649 [Reticulomyxa filosa]
MSKYYKKLQIGLFFINIYEFCICVLRKKVIFQFKKVILFFLNSSHSKKKMSFLLMLCIIHQEKKKKVYGVRPPVSARSTNENFGVEATPCCKKNKRVSIFFIFLFFLIKCLATKELEVFLFCIFSLCWDIENLEGKLGKILKKSLGKNQMEKEGNKWWEEWKINVIKGGKGGEIIEKNDIKIIEKKKEKKRKKELINAKRKKKKRVDKCKKKKGIFPKA